MRPATLAEVAELAAQGDSFDRCLANFLDGFYASPNAAALVPTPTLLAPAQGKIGKVQDAYLAATAEDVVIVVLRVSSSRLRSTVTPFRSPMVLL